MRRRSINLRVAVSSSLYPLLLLVAVGCGLAQGGREPPYQSRFVEVADLRLHYLDFGGDGLPIVLVHSEAWDAHTYEGFAPRFNDRNRVLAVTRPGYGQSEGGRYDVPSQAESLIGFLDALGIGRAVFAGNASATSELTFLAENHPERVAGVIYFSGLALPWLEEHDSDPTRAFEMFMRASPGGADMADRARARSAYRPLFLRTSGPVITVPALAFVARSGTTGNERGIGALALVGSPLMSEVRGEMAESPERDYLERLATDEEFRSRNLNQIQDSVAREYLLRLATDSVLQLEIFRYHQDVILPAMQAGQEQFVRAFGDNLKLVRLEVSHVIGYEYRNSPDLLYPHVRSFVDGLN